ncbi:hypothetical protein GCM10010399_89200 [Dactylosporangium fulvum]|uniref:Uncharacterized protein n=1 Tax=Dactylosporangium fulvum TaxID=53359 RepID=A0ABY5W6C1_9ACTN|nr:hypothetical protein [Dactylosporangium fulvum]UWP84930.1 hypothetical protein Dfulv_12145 [Dactylosporangium fulvum]
MVRRWWGWDAGAQAALSLLLVVVSLVAATPLRLPPPAPETSVAPPGTRAMWLWEREQPAPVVAWATANGVRAIFVYYDPRADAAELARLRQLRALCDEAGVTLDALGGEPTWTTDHTAALTWARAAAATGLFRRLHLDVEPYLLPSWQSLVPRFLALLDAVRAATDLPLEVDVPFWLPTITVPAPATEGGTLADAVLERVDAVTVMSYRTTATGENSMLGVAGDLLDRAAEAAKPARLAAETQPLGDCAYCSFHGTSGDRLRRTLAEVDVAAQRYPAFAGIAVHRYDTWTALAG